MVTPHPFLKRSWNGRRPSGQAASIRIAVLCDKHFLTLAVTALSETYPLPQRSFRLPPLTPLLRLPYAFLMNCSAHLKAAAGNGSGLLGVDPRSPKTVTTAIETQGSMDYASFPFVGLLAIYLQLTKRLRCAVPWLRVVGLINTDSGLNIDMLSSGTIA